jgi:hypothetical protein
MPGTFDLMLSPMRAGVATMQAVAQLQAAWWQVLHPQQRCRHGDAHAQLEVPEPLERDGERDLFA